MLLRDEIVLYVYEHKGINKLLKKLIPRYYYEDFKSEIVMIVYNMNEEKLFKAYKEKYLDMLMYRIIYSQWKSSTSPFFTKYRNNIGNVNNYKTLDLDDVNLMEVEDKEFNEYMDQYIYSKVDKVKEELTRIDPLDALVFKMYYLDDMTYMEIVDKTGVNYGTIRQMCIRSLEKIKNKI